MAPKYPHIVIKGRRIGRAYPPLVIAEIGINHEGSMSKAKRMIRDAAKAGAECVKFQTHVIEDEMISAAKKVIPGNAKESIWHIMERAALTELQEKELKKLTEKLGMIYLSTPFSRAAADRLHRMNVAAYKIGSGECNNYPLIEHIARFGKPIILSTGMNDLTSIRKAVAILRKHKVPYALLNCTSMYPTPYEKVRLGALDDFRKFFRDAVIGQSDHSLGNYTCFGAVARGASILEKHFTSSKKWSGPDVSISIDPEELNDLIVGTRAVHAALGGTKVILKEEQSTIDFAYACVVTTSQVKKGERFSPRNTWVKRPGTGEIQAIDYKKVIGKRARRTLAEGRQIAWSDLIR